MSNLADFIVNTAFPIMLVIFFTVAFVMLGHYMGPTGCDARWDGFDTTWTVQGGCKVLTESGYVPEDNFRIIATP